MVTMVSDVAIFGATCSPAQSQYVKNLNAAQHVHEFPRAAAAITDRHYVDDYLDSVDTEQEVVQLALQSSGSNWRGQSSYGEEPNYE